MPLCVRPVGLELPEREGPRPLCRRALRAHSCGHLAVHPLLASPARPLGPELGPSSPVTMSHSQAWSLPRPRANPQEGGPIRGLGAPIPQRGPTSWLWGFADPLASRSLGRPVCPPGGSSADGDEGHPRSGLAWGLPRCPVSCSRWWCPGAGEQQRPCRSPWATSWGMPAALTSPDW